MEVLWFFVITDSFNRQGSHMNNTDGPEVETGGWYTTNSYGPQLGLFVHLTRVTYWSSDGNGTRLSKS